jgi:hypothetical protein
MARWHVLPLRCPHIVRRCSRCDEPRPFLCAEAFRVNANGSRLDVWLLYRCTRCDDTWKAPVVERTPVASLDPVLHERFLGNDRDLAWRFAFDPVWLRSLGATSDDVPVTVSTEPTASPAIEIVAPYALGLRLDRLLARELGLSRSQLRARVAAGTLVIDPGGERALRQPIRDGTRVLTWASG